MAEGAREGRGAGAGVDAGVGASSSSSSSAAAGAALPTPTLAARPLHPELQADPLAHLFLSIAGIVVAHKQGHFALDCWRLQDVSRETRFVAGVTQRGTVADLIRGGLAASGVGEMLREARAWRRDESGWTQLMRAARANNVERVRQLFCLCCPNVNAQNTTGLAALHFASQYGREAVARELLVQGADLNIRDEDGFTPLMDASYCGFLAVVRLLCDAPGVDLAVRGTSVQEDDAYVELTLNALGWALEGSHEDVAAFLRSRGAPE